MGGLKGRKKGGLLAHIVYAIYASPPPGRGAQGQRNRLNQGGMQRLPPPFDARGGRPGTAGVSEPTTANWSGPAATVKHQRWFRAEASET